MVLSINTYVDPGVYFREIIVPGAINIATVPFTVGLIGVGNRDKRITDEAVQRGAIENEPLTVAGTSPHTATLIERGDRRVANTTVYADGVPLNINSLSYPAPTIIGTAAGPYDLSTVTGTRAFCIEMDGNLPITILLTHNATPAAFPGNVTITGTEVEVDYNFSGTNGDGALRSEVAAAINQALEVADNTGLGITSGGYGIAYSSAASDGTSGVRITSPLTTPNADVRIFPAIALDGSGVIFGGTGIFDAATVIQIADAIYNASVTYTIDYVSIASDADPLANTNIQRILRVGSFSGTGDFIKTIDWVEGAGVGNDLVDDDTIDWSVDTAATYTSSVSDDPAGNINLSTNFNVLLSFDGGPAITVALNGLGTGSILGYTDIGTPAQATAAEIAANINAVISNNVNYGSRYNAVADVVTSGSDNYVRLTSPTEGIASTVTIDDASTLSATTAVFGLQSGSLPYEILGTGRRPTNGSIYFATYEYTREASEYNTPIRSFTPDQAFSQVGGVTSTNQLAIASEIAFLNDAPSIFTIQIDDSSTPGSPTRNEIQAALNGAKQTDSVTDVVVLDTRLSVQTDLLTHIEQANSPTEKLWRRGWFGVARNTDIGDPDTPGTIVFLATRTLNVPATSTARGRLILVSPPNISRTIRDETGVETKVNLDSTFAAVAVAARMTSFLSPADALARKRITGFDTDDFQTYLNQERGLQASQGVTVVTLDAGLLILLDPKTTEQGGIVQLEQISGSTQKDNLVRKIDRAVDTNLVGVVPADLADFIIDVKGFIGGTIAGEIGAGSIGPYKDDNGLTRPINLLTDVQVFQDANDATQFNFQFFFNLRLPALRFFGEFSVDNPFFSVGTQTPTS